MPCTDKLFDQNPCSAIEVPLMAIHNQFLGWSHQGRNDQPMLILDRFQTRGRFDLLWMTYELPTGA